jgi:LDH2 family malate/lactate/ureidoglycolate dehydrogenase
MGWAIAFQGALIPFGGPKGSGISSVIDILVGIMTVANYGPYVGDLYNNLDRPQNVGQIMSAIYISRFCEISEFKIRVDKMIQEIKSLPKAKGVSEVFLPGEIEMRNQKQREKEGIPLPEAMVKDLQKLSDEYGIPWKQNIS